jgi:hypothetical protein
MLRESLECIWRELFRDLEWLVYLRRTALDPTARSEFTQCPEGISCTILHMTYATLRYQYDIKSIYG